MSALRQSAKGMSLNAGWRLVLGVSVLAVVLAGVVVHWSARHPVVVQHERTLCGEAETLSIEIPRGATVSQQFAAGAHNLSGFRLRLGGREQGDPYVLNIAIRKTGDSEALQTWAQAVPTTPDGVVFLFTLDRAAEPGYPYTVDISVAGDRPGGALVWMSESDAYAKGAAFVNEVEQRGDLCLTLTEELDHVTDWSWLVLYVLSALALVLYLYGRPGRGRRFRSFFEDYVFFALVSVLAVFLYRKYLWGSQLYIFDHEIASDSYSQTVPYYRAFAAQIQQYGRLIYWEPNEYLGNPRSAVFSWLNHWPCLFGSENLLLLLGFSQTLKVILAGCLFYAFLKAAGFSMAVRCSIALGYAFSGHMIARGAWSTYPGEVVAVALLFLAAEHLYRNSLAALLFPLGVYCLGVNSGTHALLLYGVVFLFYLVLRRQTDEVTLCKEPLASLLLRYGVALGVGYCLSAVMISLDVAQITSSPRLGAAASQLDQVRLISGKKTLATAYLRSISNNLQGAPLEYAGDWNYLEAAAMYSGVLTPVLCAACIVISSRRARLWFIGALLIALAYCVIEPLRTVANGFANATFKLSSFWITVLMLYMAALALEHILRNREKPLRWLAALGAAYLLPAVLLALKGRSNIDRVSLTAGVSFLAAFLNILFVMRKRGTRFTGVLLVGLMVAEVLFVSYPTVNDRATVGRGEDAYKSDVQRVVSEIQVKDPLVRFDVPIENGGALCLSLANGFMGTRGYLGGAGFDAWQNSFVSAVGSDNIEKKGFSRYMYGFSDKNEVNTMLGVKYLIYDRQDWPETYAPFGYEKLESLCTDDIVVYRNNYALPLFYTYEKAISTEQFYALTKQERQKALLERIVLDGAPEAPGVAAAEYTQNALPLEATPTRGIYLVDNRSALPYVHVAFDIVAEAEEYNTTEIVCAWGWDAETRANPENRYGIKTRRGDESIAFVVPNAGFTELELSTQAHARIENLSLTAVGEDYFDRYKQAVSDRRQDEVEVRYAGSQQYALTVDLAEPRYLFGAIAYSTGWHVRVDGEEQRVERANIGFLSTYVPEGRHEVVFTYVPPIPDAARWVEWLGIMAWLGISFAMVLRRRARAYRSGLRCQILGL